MKKKKFTLYWLTGQREVIEGYDIADAFRCAGYGGGALRALDFHANGEVDNYTWNKEKKKWESTLKVEGGETVNG